MRIKTLTIYTFSFSNPNDVEILANKSHQYAMQGYMPLFPPSLFSDTVIQQWYKEDETRINSLDFRLFMNRAMLEFKEKWDNRRWAVEYERFDEWLQNANSVWCANKSAMTLYRKFAIEAYSNTDLLKDDYCLKHKFK